MVPLPDSCFQHVSVTFGKKMKVTLQVLPTKVSDPSDDGTKDNGIWDAPFDRDGITRSNIHVDPGDAKRAKHACQAYEYGAKTEAVSDRSKYGDDNDAQQTGGTKNRPCSKFP